jgi:rhodanese-related sulfurtransferase
MSRKATIMLISMFALAIAGWFISQQSRRPGMITPAEAQDRMTADSATVILDVRTRTEWESTTGHIEGAVLIPVQELAARVGELEQYRERPVIIYCRTQNRSAHAASLLKDRGFNVSVMSGGITQWNSEQRPVIHELQGGQ